MTADQLAKGYLTLPAPEPRPPDRCLLAFFDWDEDGIFEHAAAGLNDGSWIWASSSAGKVLQVVPGAPVKWHRQWREIEGALDGRCNTLRVVNWNGARER
jgi:hypothetical protein